MMIRMRKQLAVGVILSAALAAALGARAQEPAGVVDPATLGPQVGQAAPDFSLADQNGRTWTLRSVMGPKGALVVFFRSASW